MELAQRAFADKRMERLHTRMVLKKMANHQDMAQPVRERYQFLRLFKGEAKWFLDIHVLASQQCLFGESIMVSCGSGNHNGSDRFMFQGFIKAGADLGFRRDPSG